MVSKRANTDLWQRLRALTPARIALARTGSALATDEVLRLALAHARARDAVHQPLDVDALAAAFDAAGFAHLRVHSAAPDRVTYLLRPDLGRRLRVADRDALEADAATAPDLSFVVADGLSAGAVQRHALPLLCAFRELGGAGRWSVTPVVIAEQGRVALGDEIGELMRARLVVVLIGERPGLSAPDSLGLYVTHAPRVGRTDAERNCLSNVRPGGLSVEEAARRLAWLVEAALERGLTGIALKDEAGLGAIAGREGAALPAG
ncbi:MAG TPA: ethanolamine ammonia-lyase subunit EutC [Rhodocyclaceae bacterium]|nr:ethanolamine ammonia-lyase subunit EutC [Rhodocyclaceae bacterium]